MFRIEVESKDNDADDNGDGGGHNDIDCDGGRYGDRDGDSSSHGDIDGCGSHGDKDDGSQGDIDGGGSHGDIDGDGTGYGYIDGDCNVDGVGETKYCPNTRIVVLYGQYKLIA